MEAAMKFYVVLGNMDCCLLKIASAKKSAEIPKQKPQAKTLVPTEEG